MISSIVALLCLIAALFVLYRLWIIDMRERLLPNIYTAPFALLGISFHIVTRFALEDMTGLMLGAAFGGGILLVIRMIANWHYKQDTLGLGDVKLMAAAGLWLGLEDITQALVFGACAGIIHGLVTATFHKRKTGEKLALGKLEVPAGPGFIIGILIAALAKFAHLPHLLF